MCRRIGVTTKGTAVLNDGGGSGPGAGSIRVNPGDLDGFSKFLDGVASELSGLQAQAETLVEGVDLGDYNNSAQARARYRAAGGSHAAYLQDLRTRVDLIARNTRALAARYTDIEELNAATSESITAALDAKDAQ